MVGSACFYDMVPIIRSISGFGLTLTHKVKFDVLSCGVRSKSERVDRKENEKRGYNKIQL